MNSKILFQNIKKKKSFLCIGLDTDINKIPESLHKYQDPVFEFNKQIIDATHDLCVAYKPNIAFYEQGGANGWLSLEKTVSYVKIKHPDIFLIADAKRGDIGNTCNMYAKAFFENMNFDAITVAPYMGEDSVKPFLLYKDKWAILLALTSNKSASDFQFDNIETNLYEKVISKSKKWGTEDNLMYVVGATKAEMLEDIRKIIPDNFLLVPGVGAQGGSLSEVAKYGMNKKCGLLVNSSRSILYADNSANFAKYSREKASELKSEMEELLQEYIK
ncbi:MAG: orotidine-5'-phosphate decarboxylase [Bacteroidetes bacterium]|nr:orotidine-5'-phosphate decarboxylase [Bacteroidota bacterium]